MPVLQPNPTTIQKGIPQDMKLLDAIKKLLRLIKRPSEQELEEIFEELLKEGYLELIGYDHGEELYRTTEKGVKFLEDQKT